MSVPTKSRPRRGGWGGGRCKNKITWKTRKLRALTIRLSDSSLALYVSQLTTCSETIPRSDIIMSGGMCVRQLDSYGRRLRQVAAWAARGELPLVGARIGKTGHTFLSMRYSVPPLPVIERVKRSSVASASFSLKTAATEALSLTA